MVDMHRKFPSLCLDDKALLMGDGVVTSEVNSEVVIKDVANHHLEGEGDVDITSGELKPNSDDQHVELEKGKRQNSNTVGSRTSYDKVRSIYE